MSKTVNLHDCRTYEGEAYGPGPDIEIPDEMYDALLEIGYFGEEEGSDALFEGCSEEEGSDALFEGCSEEQASNLKAAGYDSPEAISAASQEDLVAVDEIGPATAKKLKERADD